MVPFGQAANTGAVSQTHLPERKGTPMDMTKSKKRLIPHKKTHSWSEYLPMNMQSHGLMFMSVFYVQLIGLWNISGKPWIDCHIKNVGTKPLYIFSVIPCNNFVGFLSTSIGCQSSYSSFVRILMVQFNLGTPHCLKKWLNANNPMRKIIRVPFSVEFSWASPAWKNTRPKLTKTNIKITFTNIQHKII